MLPYGHDRSRAQQGTGDWLFGKLCLICQLNPFDDASSSELEMHFHGNDYHRKLDKKLDLCYP